MGTREVTVDESTQLNVGFDPASATSSPTCGGTGK